MNLKNDGFGMISFRGKHLYIFVFFLLIFLAPSLVGQIPEDGPSMALYKKALAYQRQGKDKKAVKIFHKILKGHPEHIKSILGLAGIYYHQNDNENASLYLRRAIEIDPDFDPEMYYSLALTLERLGKRKEAIMEYEHFLKYPEVNQKKRTFVERRMDQLSFIVDAMQHPVEFNPVDPGPNINTSAQEYLATLDIAGDLMVFSRRSNQQEDLFSSIFSDGKWQVAVPIRDLNTSQNEAAHCLSPDGRTIIFTSCDRREGFGSCDLYVSHQVSGAWTEPVNMGPPINSPNWESQPSITSDGNTLFFSSSRPGGFGGRDIWFSKKNEDGFWTKPQNAGPMINTEWNEESPFIHPDNYTLYFMSNGHPGMGGFDLFVSYMRGGNWAKPQNLGYPINTDADEGAIRVAADGITAYFSTDRIDLTGNINPNLDIFSFKLPENVRAQPVSYVKGKVVEVRSLAPLEVTILWSDNFTGNKISEVNTDPDGGFIFPLPAGISYNLLIDQPGYLYHSEYFQPADQNDRTDPQNILIKLIPIEAGVDSTQWQEKPVILKNIFFESGSSVLNLKKSALELNHLYAFLSRNNTIKIQIRGHTDNVGSAADNLQLSVMRAKAVFEFLVSQGISKDRMDYTGFGEEKPIGDNDTPEGRQLNRRTEFIIQS